MTGPVLAVLSFLLLPAEPGRAPEEGRIIAATCEAAEAWLRAGLRPGQAVITTGCVQVAADRADAEARQ